MTYWNDSKDHFDWSCENNEIANKLAAYKDIGLEPEEIKLNMDGLDEYRKAEAEGRLVILPCKVGDTVYVKWSGGREYSKSVVKKISIDTDGQVRFLIPAYLHSHSASWYQTSDFGKTVFLSHAEASMMEGDRE